MNKLLVLALVAAGCQSTKARATAGATMAVVGGALLLTADRGDCSAMELGRAIDCGIEETAQTGVGTAVLAAGVATVLGALIVHSREEARRQVAAPSVPRPAVYTRVPRMIEPATAVPMLRQLTLQAGTAARRGDCATVDAIAIRVDELDAGYRTAGFASDPFVAECLR